jgi:hypothetical protein
LDRVSNYVRLLSTDCVGVGAGHGDDRFVVLVEDAEHGVADLDGDDASGVAETDLHGLAVSWVAQAEDMIRWTRAARRSISGARPAGRAPCSLKPPLPAGQ